MPRKTRADLQRTIDELVQELAQAKGPPNMNTITVVYTMQGQLVSVVTSRLDSGAALRAAKAALANLSVQVDAALYQAVEREAGAMAQAKKDDTE